MSAIVFKFGLLNPVKNQFQNLLRRLNQSVFKGQFDVKNFMIIIQNMNIDDMDNQNTSQDVKQLWKCKKDFYNKIVQQIQKWQIESYQQNINQHILQKISHINFTKLTSLNLSQSRINSIQALFWMNIPCLKHLNINDCNLMSLKPFSKTKMSNLQLIDLRDNLCVSFLEYKHLNRLKILTDKQDGQIFRMSFTAIYQGMVFSQKKIQANGIINHRKDNLQVYYNLVKFQSLSLILLQKSTQFLQLPLNIPQKIQKVLRQRYDVYSRI